MSWEPVALTQSSCCWSLWWTWAWWHGWRTPWWRKREARSFRSNEFCFEHFLSIIQHSGSTEPHNKEEVPSRFSGGKMKRPLCRWYYTTLKPCHLYVMLMIALYSATAPPYCLPYTKLRNNNSVLVWLQSFNVLLSRIDSPSVESWTCPDSRPIYHYRIQLYDGGQGSF